MTKLRGCWDVRRNRRTHYIRSIDGEGWTTIPEGGIGAVGELGRIVLWVSVQLDASPTRPSLDERVGDRSGSKDGVDTLERNGCAKSFDHLPYPRKNVAGTELIDGQWSADEHGVRSLRTRGDRENEI